MIAPDISTENQTSPLLLNISNNDFHHHHFSESEYWDESHNWSDDADSVSDEYWHFLGLYE
jgi:hypothetical protein